MIDDKMISALCRLDKRNMELLFNELAGALKAMKHNEGFSSGYVSASNVITDILTSYVDDLGGERNDKKC